MDHASPADALHVRPAKEVGPQSGPSQSPALPDAVACETRCAYVWLGHGRWQSTTGTPLREQMLQMYAASAFLFMMILLLSAANTAFHLRQGADDLQHWHMSPKAMAAT